MMLARVGGLFMLLCWVASVYASEAIHVFSSEQQQSRYQHLISEFRCPVCQNQSIADSEADLAADLRQKTYELIMAGESDAQIKHFMQQRYGDFVLYEPRVTSLTWPLWVAPIVVLLIVIGGFIWRHRQNNSADKDS